MMLQLVGTFMSLSAANRCGYKKTTLSKGCPFAKVGTSEHTAAVFSSAAANARHCSHSLGPNIASTLGGVRHALARALRAHSAAEGRAPEYELERWAAHPSEGGVQQPQQICEIGLNTGHSALLWLCAFPQARYHSLDLMRFNATVRAAAFLRRAFPGRVDFTAGDTKVTLAALANARSLQCDVMSIDGDHSFKGASSDLGNMRALARPGGRSVVIMDDLRCGAWWCGGPTAAWHLANASGMVREAGCEVLGCCTGWCFGEYL